MEKTTQCTLLINSFFNLFYSRSHPIIRCELIGE